MIYFLLTTFLISIISFSSSVTIRSYNKINYIEYHSIESLLINIFTNDGTSNINLFLGVSKPECFNQEWTPAFKGAQRHAGGNTLAVASIPSNDFPITLNSCSEIFFYPINTPIANPTSRTSNFEHSYLTSWENELMRTSIKFINHFPFEVCIFWSDESTEPISNGFLQSNESFIINSFLGHVFSMKEVLSNGTIGRLVDFMAVDGSEYIINSLNRLETCEIITGLQKFTDGDVTCDDMEMRLLEFSHNVWYEKRLGLNFVQPQMVRAVTVKGFENRRLPADTYKWLKEWYDISKKEENIESGVGPCMNQHISPSLITHLSADNKNRLSRELQSTMEEWYGAGTLELTSIYGIRKYINGSVLRMHIDTAQTHVVSAIINIDQVVDEEWPLIILDHQDREHSILMKPGDMLLYESSKLLHGRPDAFIGSHYDNIFIHYKPTTGWNYDWV